MPAKTAPGLSIRALPFQGVARAQQQQMLSPSALRQPATELFALQVSTLPPLPLRKRYVVTVQRTSRLMRKSALFYDLASQYATLSHKDDNNDNYGYYVSPQLPTICIEAPVRSDHAEMVDVMFEWLFADDSDGANAADTVLASALAPRIRGSQAFFALVHFATLLDLFEPYCTTIDRLLVYYYFGLSPDERRNSILRSDQFVEGVLPGRFARRLAEVVGEEEAQEMVASFFRNRQPLSAKVNGNDSYFRLSLAFENLQSPGTPVTYDEHVLRSTALKVQTPLSATSFTSLPFVSSPTSSPISASPPIHTPSPFDRAEPPTPRGSACMFVPPTTPSTPDIQRIFPRVHSAVPCLPRRVPNRSSQRGRVSNRAFDVPNAPATPSTPTFRTTAAPPNTPATATLPAPFNDVDDSHESPLVVGVPPNTPMTPATARSIPESRGSPLSPLAASSSPAVSSPLAASSPPAVSSPLPPPTPTIKINGNDHYDSDDDDDDNGNSNGKSSLTSPKRSPSGLHRANSYAFIRRELFEFALTKIRKRASM